MTEPIDEAEAERHRAKMVKRKAVQDAEVARQDHREGPADRPYRPRQGQVDGRLRPCAAHARPRLAGRRRAVHQGRLAHGERDALAAFGDQVSWHTMGEGFTWETQDHARDIAAAERAWAKARELMADPSDRPRRARRAQHRAALRLSRLAEVVAALTARRAGPACRRHRPQRQAGADRGRRSRHRDDAGEASFRRRREGAARHRVLMTARALMFQGTGSDVGKSLIVAGLARAFTQPRPRGAAVQAAEHVEQRRGDGRRRRDRPRPGAAGARRARAAERAHEPGAAEAAERDRRAGRGAGPGVRHRQGRGISGHEAGADAVRARQLRAAAAARPISCWSRAPAARRRSICARNDIANMGFARAADVPVVLIGDIDRGGVIASLVGTKAVIDSATMRR